MVENLFSKDTRVLVKGGEINDVQGDYHHYDYSRRITNNGSYNITGNTIHNVGNIGRQVIYHDSDGRGSRSMHHGRFASSSVVTADASDNASSRYHTPHSQVPIQVPNNPNPLSYGYLAPQSPGQYFYTQPGDIRQMSTGQSAFMNNEMANMTQEIESEFSGENEEQNTFGADMYSDDTFEDDATRSQSLSADFNCLTIEDRRGVFSSRSTLTYGSSSTSVRANKNPKHIIIQGDHTEVDNNFYQSNFDSHKVKNNIIKNSFGEGE